MKPRRAVQPAQTLDVLLWAALLAEGAGKREDRR